MTNKINTEINNILYAIKPAKYYKGYYQAISVLTICCNDESAMDSLDKKVYPLVGEIYDCNPKCIEKNIRLFLDNIDYSVLSDILNVNINHPLEVKEFVYIVTAYISNKYSALVYL